MIVTIGDLLLDVIVRLGQPLAEGADADATTQLGPGGQAANVAAWVAELGGTARFVGKLADDEAGGIAARALERYGVEVRGPVVDGPHGHRRLAGRGRREPDDGLRPRRLARARGRRSSTRPGSTAARTCTCPGYSLLRSPIDEASLRAAGLAPQVSVDLSSWSAIRDFGPERFRERLEALRPAIVFANEDEERILGGPLEGCTWVLKRGGLGARFGDARAARRVPAEVIDTTGAGDALAAGYLVGGPELALAAAARCVAKLGSMP